MGKAVRGAEMDKPRSAIRVSGTAVRLDTVYGVRRRHVDIVEMQRRWHLGGQEEYQQERHDEVLLG
jgi:hypothetical protein